jgi:hypothetical protein
MARPEPVEVRVKVTVEGPQSDGPDPGPLWAEWICQAILAGDFDDHLEDILEAAHHRKRERRERRH